MKKGMIAGLISGLAFFLLFPSFHVRDLRAVSPQMGKPSVKPQPDLIVEKVWLDLQCHILLKMKNAGNGSISDTDHSKGVVRVHYGRAHEDFYFTRASSAGKPPVDSAGALKSPGGAVQYDTKIKLESPMSVVVIVDADNKITESKEENNRFSQNLTPQCPAISQVTPAKPKEGFLIDKDRLDRSGTPYHKKDEGENGFRPPPWGDRKPETADQRERRSEQWGKTLQRKPIVIIDEPKEYTVWYAGCQYKIAWRSNVDTGFRIKFMFHDEVAWTFTPAGLKQVKTEDYYVYSTSWTVPDNAPWKESSFPYIVVVESLDGKVSGKRDYLNIHAFGVEILSPPPRPERGAWSVSVRRGSIYNITWGYYGCTFNYFDIILETTSPNGPAPRYIQRALEARPDRGGPGEWCQQTFSWTIPEDLRDDLRYLIKVVGHRQHYGFHRREDFIYSDIGGPIVVSRY